MVNFTFVLRASLIVVIAATKVAAISFLRKQDWNASLQVSTKFGRLQGYEAKSYHGRSYLAYEGVPYARPPTGNLRFRSPRPTVKWKGVLDATKEGSNCVEIRMRLSGIFLLGNEDCLFLNIYYPLGPANIKKRYPVLFFIYGGGFLDGQATKSLYGPDYLVEQDLVVVTFNYRLNVFGFLSTEDEVSPGNYGLKDQNLALRWVKDNIGKFGGDHERITIAGQSAGACSIMYHMVSPKSRGLFSSAIAISGDSLAVWSIQRVPKRIANDIGLYFGMETNNSTELIENLRRLSTEQLKKVLANILIADGVFIFDNGLVFTPVIEKPHEDAFVTELSYESLKNGRFARVPLMIGFTSKEVNFFIRALQLAQPFLLLHDLSPSMVPASLNIKTQVERRTVGKRIKEKYFKNHDISTGSPEELVDYFTDLLYVRPITQSAKLASKYTPVHLYLYKKDLANIKDLAVKLGFPVDTSLRGPGHTEDLACVWKVGIFDPDSEMEQFCNRYLRIWKNFAYYGVPTIEPPDPELQNLSWPPIQDPNNLTYFIIDDDMSVAQNYRKDFIDFWDEIFKNYGTEPYYSY